VSWRHWVRGVEVEPSLYAADFMRLGDQVATLLTAGARIFHVDVGDGRFIPPITIGPVVVRSLAPTVHAAGGRLDCHLMVAEPERHFEQIKQAGGDSVTVHVEACDDVERAAALARSLGLGIGLAFNPGTPVETAASRSAGFDLVLCMSVHPGYSGQAFLPESTERVRRLRSLLPEETLVQIDGGLGAGNAGDVRAAGADLLVAGSAIFAAADVAEAYAGLVRAVGQ
jgi:ribulose-phosphate 3-epimerase